MHRFVPLALCAVVLLMVTGCAPGNARWNVELGGSPANFWAGLWHGLIIVVTFIVSLFTDDVNIYEPSNVGWGYNIGFIIGCMISLGGGAGATTRRHKPKVVVRAVGVRIGARVAEGVRAGIRAAFADTDAGDSRTGGDRVDWDELGRRIEERIRQELDRSDKEA